MKSTTPMQADARGSSPPIRDCYPLTSAGSPSSASCCPIDLLGCVTAPRPHVESLMEVPSWTNRSTREPPMCHKKYGVGSARSRTRGDPLGGDPSGRARGDPPGGGRWNDPPGFRQGGTFPPGDDPPRSAVGGFPSADPDGGRPPGRVRDGPPGGVRSNDPPGDDPPRSAVGGFPSADPDGGRPPGRVRDGPPGGVRSNDPPGGVRSNDPPGDDPPRSAGGGFPSAHPDGGRPPDRARGDPPGFWQGGTFPPGDDPPRSAGGGFPSVRLDGPRPPGRTPCDPSEWSHHIGSLFRERVSHPYAMVRRKPISFQTNHSITGLSSPRRTRPGGRMPLRKRINQGG